METKQVDFSLYDEDVYIFFRVGNSKLNIATLKVVNSYVLEHYQCHVASSNGQSYYIFNHKDVDQDLQELLHDLSFTPISKSERMKDMKQNEEQEFDYHVSNIISELKIKTPNFIYGMDNIINFISDKEFMEKHKITEEQIRDFKNDKTNGFFICDEELSIVAIELKNRSGIGTAAHELRHAFQYENSKSFPKKLSIFSKSGKFANIIDKFIYTLSPWEFDANRYALCYCFKNKIWKSGVDKYLFRLITSVCWLIIFTLFLCSLLTVVIHLR